MNFSRTDTKAVKAVAIIMMLFHHLFVFPERIDSSIVYTPLIVIGEYSADFLFGEFGKLCIALFLFLGGYGTYLSCCNSANVSKTISRKIKAQYIAYWKVFVLVVPVCMLMNVERVEKRLLDFVWNFSGLQISYCGNGGFLLLM